MSTSQDASALPTLDGTDGTITIRKWVTSIEDVLSDGRGNSWPGAVVVLVVFAQLHLCPSFLR